MRVRFTWAILVTAMVSASAGVAVTLIAQKDVQRSTTFDWTKLREQTTNVGSRRDVMRASTPTLDMLEMHVTTLNPGAVSHAPHQHAEEELLIVREGQVETLQNGVATRLGPGSIIFHSTNDLHNVRNVGTTPATYHVVQWRVAPAR